MMISEGRHRPHGPRERPARHPCRAPRDLDQKPDGRLLGAEDGLHPSATLPPDRCHLDDAAVRIDRHHRDDTAIGEVYMVERTVGVREDLPALAVTLFKLWYEPLEIAGWEGEQKPIAGPIRWSSHTLVIGSLWLQVRPAGNRRPRSARKPWPVTASDVRARRRCASYCSVVSGSRPRAPFASLRDHGGPTTPSARRAGRWPGR